MAQANGKIPCGEGIEVTGYYGLAAPVQELMRMLSIETAALQPDEAENFNFLGTFIIGIEPDPAGTGEILVAFRPESPLNPSAGR